MKKSVYTSFLFFLAIVFLLPGLSCRKKYEEDPWTMRFVNLGKRIEGEWSIQKILIDGVDSTAIIYVDSLQIFSTYIFSDYSHSYARGKLEARTYNRIYGYDGIRFNFFIPDNLDTIGFGSEGPGPNTNLLNNNIIPYGPINDFVSDASGWYIHKLTKKELHLSNTYYSKKYELFFKKA